MTKKEKTLKEMFEDNDSWVFNSPTRSWSKLKPDEISIAFLKTKKDEDCARKVTIRFGQDVMDLLNWKEGDRLYVLNHKDDLMAFRLTKASKNNEGYKIGKESSTHHFHVSLTWKHPLNLDPLPQTTVKYEIFKKSQVLFRAERKN